MSVAPDGFFSQESTPNGTNYSYKGAAAAQAVMLSMQKLDSAVAQAAGRGVAGARYVRPSNEGSLNQTIALRIVNLTRWSIVPWDYVAKNASASNLTGPISPGGESRAEFVNVSGGFPKGSTIVSVDTLFAGGAASLQTNLTGVDANCILAYDNDGNWMPQVNVDGIGTALPNQNMNLLYAVLFHSNSAEKASFTVAVQGGLQTPSGEATFYFLPTCEVPLSGDSSE